MKTKIISLLLSACLLIACKESYESVISSKSSIVILYENDVHCAIEERGYEKLAGLRDVIADTAFVGIVSEGDFVQGGIAGTLSEGQWIIDIMKQVGYDAVTIGNHEFDYGVPRQKELLSQLKTGVTCANFLDSKTNEEVYPAYVMKQYGATKIAFIGVITPKTMQSESYSFYENDVPRYTLQPDEVAQLVQSAANEARIAGAKYVIVISHLGETKEENYITSYELVKQTQGIDVVLDGHTHHAVDTLIENAIGELIPVTQTKNKFAYIGKLDISPSGNFSNTLIPLSSISYCNERVKNTTDSILKIYNSRTEEVIGRSEVKLRVYGGGDTVIIRQRETNAGDFVTDAFKTIMNAQIGIINAGSFRKDLYAGEVKYGDIINMNPYGNTLCKIRVQGSLLKTAIEVSLGSGQLGKGSFMQVSGIKYIINKSGETYSLGDVCFLNNNTEEAIDDDAFYTVATTTYVRDSDYNGTFKDCETLEESPMTDYECTKEYLVRELGGVISFDKYGSEYGEGRIVFYE